MSGSDLLDGLWGATLGGVIGALGTGAAQIFSFRHGAKTSRAGQSHHAAAELLEVVHTCDRVLVTLPYTDNAAGSPLSYGDRLSEYVINGSSCWGRVRRLVMTSAIVVRLY